MGYNTDFQGMFDLDRPLAPEHKAYLIAFANTRRMRRDATKTEGRADPTRLAARLPIGPEGGYFVGEEGFMGQKTAGDVTDGNHSPEGQPGLWCKWEPTDDGLHIAWNGNEKFYDYVEWLDYLIEHFLEPWGYVLNGEVKWRGEEFDDLGVILVIENHVATGPYGAPKTEPPGLTKPVTY
jgi:hypothetical protein